MQKASSLPTKWQNVVLLLTALFVVAGDQFSKSWVRANLAIGQSIPQTGFPRLTHVYNTGSAFGLFSGQSFPLTIIALFGVAVIVVYAFLVHRRYPFLDNQLSKIALGLVLGGTIGNLIDRLQFGFVTDFIDFGFWPAFNLADSSIVVGVFIFAYSLYSLAKKQQGG